MKGNWLFLCWIMTAALFLAGCGSKVERTPVPKGPLSNRVPPKAPSDDQGK
jgi:hypothetical protein